MRLEWIEDILAVAQTGSFSEAAQKRNLTQSAFSRRVQMIEEAIGVELFDRSHKPVQLRATTEAQRDRMQQIAANLRSLVEELRRGERLALNRIVIASQHALTTSYAPRLVQRIQATGTEVYTRLRSANLDECLGLLLSRQADIALLYQLPNGEAAIGGDFIECLRVDGDRLVPYAAPALARKLNVDGGTIPVVAYPADVYFGRIFTMSVQPRVDPRFTLAPKVETALTLAAVELAAVGAGVAWLPRSLAERSPAAGSLVSLADILPDADLEIIAVRLTGGSSPAEHIVWSLLASEAEGRRDR